MLNTVLRNLISNALKFTQIGGEIKVTAQHNDKNSLEIAVCDNGVGISSSDLKKLFRLDVSHSTNGTNQEQGTGLGLILCQELVEKQNGSIWVESKIGKGSSFCFSIPIEKP